MKTSTRRLLVVLGIVLGAAAVPALSVLNTSHGYQATAGVTFNASSGPAVEINDTYRIENGSAFPDDNTVTLQDTTFVSQGHSEVRVEQFGGTYTRLSSLNVSGTRLRINPPDKPVAEVDGDLDTFEWRDPTIDDGTVDFRYGGTGSSATVVIHGVEPGTPIGAVDEDTGDLLAANISSSNGVLVLDGLPLSDHDVLLQESESAPRISSASPQGDQSTAPTELTVSVDDLDFPDDTVTATFFLDGTQVGTDSRSSSGELNTSISKPSGGTHNYTVVLEDEYGQTTTETYEFGSPATLEIRQETNPSELIDDRQVNLTIYASDQIITRNVSDGTMNLSGLPAGETLVIQARANGYVERRVTIDRLSESEEVYLLNASEATALVAFELRDFTGNYPTDDTVLRVQRSINGQWDTVLADGFDANGEVTGTLETDIRYRLVVENTETGDRRVAGTITPVADGRFIVEVTGVGIINILRPDPIVTHSPGADSLPAVDTASSSVTVDEGTTTLSWFETTWYLEYANGTRQMIDSTNQSDPTRVSEDLNLSGRAGATIVVETEWRVESGKTGTTTKRYRIRQAYQTDNSLLDALGSVSGLLPAQNVTSFELLVALFATIGLTASVGQRLVLSSVQTGIVALAMLSAWSVIGWVSYEVLFLAGVAFITGIAVRRRI